MSVPPPSPAGLSRGGRALAILIGVLLLLVLVLAVASVVYHPGGGDTRAAITPFSISAGPEAGVDLASYATARQAALAKLAVPGWAIVSFDAYHPFAAVRQAAGPFRIGAFAVAAPGGFPSTISPSDGSIRTWVSQTRSNANSDAAGIRKMLPTTNDPDTATYFRSELTRLAAVAKVKSSDAVVFGVVVNGTPQALRNLAGATGVRLVDPIGVKLPDLLGVAAVRPEETMTAGTPQDRPAP